MGRPEPSLRDQLVQARAALQRQLEVLGAGPMYNILPATTVDNRALIGELSAELAQVEEALAGLERE